MKRSKIFLAATAGLLAVVDFVSAKAHKTMPPVFYSLGNGNIGCTAAQTNLLAHPAQPAEGVIGYATLGTRGILCSGVPLAAGEN